MAQFLLINIVDRCSLNSNKSIDLFTCVENGEINNYIILIILEMFMDWFTSFGGKIKPRALLNLNRLIKNSINVICIHHNSRMKMPFFFEK